MFLLAVSSWVAVVWSIRSVVFDPIDAPQLDALVLGPVEAPPMSTPDVSEASDAPQAELPPVTLPANEFPSQPDVVVMTTPSLEAIRVSLEPKPAESEELTESKRILDSF